MQVKGRMRHGASAVEAAVMLSAFFLLFFGILEYCRFTWVRQICQNAAREGARYAVAMTHEVVESPVSNADTKTTEVQNRVLAALGGTQNQVRNHANANNAFAISLTSTSGVRIFRSNSAGMPQNVNTDGSLATAEGSLNNWYNGKWFRSRFGDNVTCQIACNYRPLFTAMLKIADPLPLTFTSVMASEAN